MKRIILTLLAAIAAVVPAAQAGATSVLLNGQKQYYTVQLRSDKQAIVYTRVVFENPSASTDLATYEFSLPSGVTARNLSAQQILAKSSNAQDCKTYETLEQWRTRSGSGLLYSPDTAYTDNRRCIEWQDGATYDTDYDYDSNLAGTTSYYRYSYYQNQDTRYDYSDAALTNKDSTYTATLPTPVKPGKQGSILLSFTTNDFVTGGLLGRYNYNVRTLLANQMISQSTVAINFDDDMYSREATQQRGYEATAQSSTAGVAATSKSTDSLVASIGTGGVYVKTQSALLPGDTLRVNGVFATNPVVLYSTQIIIGLLILAIIGAAIMWYRRWRKKHPHTAAAHATKTAAAATPVGTWRPIAATCGVSIISTLLLLLIFANAIVRASYNTSSTVIFISIVSIIIAVFFSTTLLPALFLARYGTKVVFKWAIVQFIALVVLLLVASLFITPGTVMPMYGA